MKKVYEKPQASAVELRTSRELLLPASPGQTTDECFARKHIYYDDDWYEECNN